MGNICNSLTEQEAEEKQKSNNINRAINKKQQIDDNVHKLLLLGAGESGKSTLFKQMISLYGPGFSEDERLAYVPVIYSNIILSIRKLLEESPNYGGLTSEEGKVAAEWLQENVLSDGKTINEETAANIATLWRDPGFVRTFENRAKFQLKISDSLNFFMRDDVLGAVGSANYVPTEEHILRCRIRTTGIVENEFKIAGSCFKMFDVGGQRSERKKWIHCFQDVRAVLFVAAISEYDQVLFEDESMNRVVEALNLFGQIVNSQWFKKTSIMLFLNKSDLFQEKIRTVSIRTQFPQYVGDTTDYMATTSFMEDMFKEKVGDPDKAQDLYTHVTCATNKENVDIVFQGVRDSVLKEALRDADMLA
jgi:GTPase SAR1 family protein